MDRQALVDACLNMKGAEETFPFGEDVAVFKVMGKMFALVPVDAELPSISLKCDPQLAIILRQTYKGVNEGYHLSKKHWNTVTVDGEVPEDELLEMIDNSYALVVKGLKKAERQQLEALE